MWAPFWALWPSSIIPAPRTQVSLLGVHYVKTGPGFASPFIFLSACGQHFSCSAIWLTSLFFLLGPVIWAFHSHALISKSGTAFNTRRGDCLMLLSQTFIPSPLWSTQGLQVMIVVLPWSSKSLYDFFPRCTFSVYILKSRKMLFFSPKTCSNPSTCPKPPGRASYWLTLYNTRGHI